MIERGGHKPVNKKRWSQVSSREEVVTGQLIKRGSHRSVHGKNWSRRFTGRAGHRSRKKGETRMTACILKQNPNTLNKIRSVLLILLCVWIWSQVGSHEDVVTGQFTGKSCLVGAAAGRDIPSQFTGRCPKSLTVHIQHWKMEEMVPQWLAVN